MVSLFNMRPDRFKQIFPRGAYTYVLDWSPDKIKPSFIVYPFKMDTEHSGSASYLSFVGYDLQKGKPCVANHMFFRAELASTDLNEIIESFEKSIKRAVEGRKKWLKEQEIALDKTADSMYTKLKKIKV